MKWPHLNYHGIEATSFQASLERKGSFPNTENLPVSGVLAKSFAGTTEAQNWVYPSTFQMQSLSDKTEHISDEFQAIAGDIQATYIPCCWW
jgi:hypothetical protein